MKFKKGIDLFLDWYFEMVQKLSNLFIYFHKFFLLLKDEIFYFEKLYFY